MTAPIAKDVSSSNEVPLGKLTAYRLDSEKILATFTPQDKKIWDGLNETKQLKSLVKRTIRAYNAKKAAKAADGQFKKVVLKSKEHWKSEERKNFQCFVYAREIEQQGGGVAAFFKSLGAENDFTIKRTDTLSFFVRCVVLPSSTRVYDLFALATGKGWKAVAVFFDERFTNIISRVLLNPKGVVGKTRRPLLGDTVMVDEKRERGGRGEPNLAQFSVTQSIKSQLKREVLPEELQKIFPEKTFVQAFTYGLMINKKLLPSQFALVFDLYSRILHPPNQESAFVRDESGFKYLDQVKQVSGEMTAQLDSLLLQELWRAFRAPFPHATSLRFCHRLVNDYFRANKYSLHGNHIPRKSLDFKWTAFKTAAEMIALLQKIPKLKEAAQRNSIETFGSILSGIKLKCDTIQTPTSLLKCFEGEVIVSETGSHYFYLGGRWYQISFDLFANLHEEFQLLLDNCLIKKGEEGFLPEPWKGRKKRAKGDEKERENVEGEYNLSYASRDGYLVGDTICPDHVEIFDIALVGETIYLYQVKEEFNHRTRDAASQLMNAATCLNDVINDTTGNHPFFEQFEAELKKKKEEDDRFSACYQKLIALGGGKGLANRLRNTPRNQIVFVYAFANKSAKVRDIESELTLVKRVTVDDLKGVSGDLSTKIAPAKVLAALEEHKFLDEQGGVTSHLLRCFVGAEKNKLVQAKKSFCEKFAAIDWTAEDKEILYRYLNDMMGTKFSSIIPRFSLLDVKKKIADECHFVFKICQIPSKKDARRKEEETSSLDECVIYPNLPAKPSTALFLPGTRFRAEETQYKILFTRDEGLSPLHAALGEYEETAKECLWNTNPSKPRQFFYEWVINRLDSEDTAEADFFRKCLIESLFTLVDGIVLSDSTRKQQAAKLESRYKDKHGIEWNKNLKELRDLESTYKDSVASEEEVFCAYFNACERKQNLELLLSALKGKNVAAGKAAKAVYDAYKKDKQLLLKDYRENVCAVREYIKANARTSAKIDSQFKELSEAIANYDAKKNQYKENLNRENRLVNAYLECLKSPDYPFGWIELELSAALFDLRINVFNSHGGGVNLKTFRPDLTNQTHVFFSPSDSGGGHFFRCVACADEDDSSSEDEASDHEVASNSTQDVPLAGQAMRDPSDAAATPGFATSGGAELEIPSLTPPLGLSNEGNTCFINSTFQMIMNDDALCQAIIGTFKLEIQRHRAFKVFTEWMNGKQADDALGSVLPDILLMIARIQNFPWPDSEDFLTLKTRLEEIKKSLRNNEDMPSSGQEELLPEMKKLACSEPIKKLVYSKIQENRQKLMAFSAFIKAEEAYRQAKAEKKGVVPRIVSKSDNSEKLLQDLRYLMPKSIGHSQEDASELLRAILTWVQGANYPDLFFGVGVARQYEQYVSKDEADGKRKEDEYLEKVNKSKTTKDPNNQLTQLSEDNCLIRVDGFDCMLSIPIIRDTNGQDLLDEFMTCLRPPVETGDPAVFANGWFQLKGERTILEPAPKRFILELKRFERKAGKTNKIKTVVQMPEEVKLKNQTYRVKSIVVHSGEASGGHYVTYIKSEGTWWRISDEKVAIAPDLSQGLNHGYLYFYELAT